MTNDRWVAVFDDAQVGFERRKGVVAIFGLAADRGCQQRRFARVRETDQSDVGQQLQFQNEPAFGAVFAGLGVARRLIGRPS